MAKLPIVKLLIGRLYAIDVYKRIDALPIGQTACREIAYREILTITLIDVCDCKLLTTFERARTLSFKITIKPHHFEKAKNPSIWPYRVGVRVFKHFTANNRNKNNPGESVRFAQDLQVISLV